MCVDGLHRVEMERIRGKNIVRSEAASMNLEAYDLSLEARYEEALSLYREAGEAVEDLPGAIAVSEASMQGEAAVLYLMRNKDMQEVKSLLQESEALIDYGQFDEARSALSKAEELASHLPEDYEPRCEILGDIKAALSHFMAEEHARDQLLKDVKVQEVADDEQKRKEKLKSLSRHNPMRL